MRKKSVNHAEVTHVLDGCHLCEHYIIMYACTFISIYVHINILCTMGQPMKQTLYVRMLYLIKYE